MAPPDFSSATDPVTGLPNRRQLMKALIEATRAGDAAGGGALVLLGIDDISHLNEAHGYEAGDRARRAVGEAVEDCAGKRDLPASVGGDEFGLLLRNRGREAALEEALRLVRAVARLEVPAGEHSEHITASAGVALFPEHSNSPEELVSMASIAMKHSRARGRGAAAVFQPDYDLPAIEDLENARHLIYDALSNDRIVLYRQPIVETSTGQKQAFEVLARIVDQDDQIRMPGEWLPQAEQMGLMPAIDRRIIDLTFSSLGATPEVWCSCRAGINVSSASITEEMAEYIVAMGRLHGISPGQVTVEITESGAAPDMDGLQGFMEVLRGEGYSIAIDDFGSGNTSLKRIRELEVDVVKLDGSLVTPVETSESDLRFLTALIELIHSMDMRIVAEYVESPRTLKLLNEMGVDLVQGYLLGRPGPVPSSATEVLSPCA